MPYSFMLLTLENTYDLYQQGNQCQYFPTFLSTCPAVFPIGVTLKGYATLMIEQPSALA